MSPDSPYTNPTTFDPPYKTGLLLVGGIVLGVFMYPSLFPILIFYILYTTSIDIYRFFTLAKNHPRQARTRYGDETNFGFGIPVLTMMLGLIPFTYIMSTYTFSIPLTVFMGFIILILLPSLLSTTIIVGTLTHYQRTQDQ